MGREDEAEQEVSLSVEETNKIRISLGLKPLTEGNSTEKEKTAEDNYQQYKEEQQRKQEGQEVLERIEKAKNRAARDRKLKGATLGDASDDDASGDALAWVEKQKQKDEERRLKKQKLREQALAKKKAKELEEMDESVVSAGASTASGSRGKLKKGGKAGDEGAADLAGLTVSHSLEDVAESGEVILTLKDAGVLDEEEGDVLQNVSLAEQERTRENLQNKKKKTAYDVFNEDEYSTPGVKRNILSQYDDEPKPTSFTLNETGKIDLNEEERKNKISHGMREGAVALEYQKNKEIRDYYTQEEMVAFKKPKKKKKVRKERTRLELDEDQDVGGGGRDHGSRGKRGGGERDAMDVDGEEGVEKKEEEKEEKKRVMDYSFSNRFANVGETNFVDDDELQSALARARRVTVKKMMKSDVEEIARAALQIREEEPTTEEGGVVLSATSEFVSNLATAPVFKAPEPKPAPRHTARVEADDDEKKEEAKPMEVEEDQAEEGGWVGDEGEGEEGAGRQKDVVMRDGDEEEEGGDLVVSIGHSFFAHADTPLNIQTPARKQEAPIEEEPLVSAGLGATLRLLTQKGFVEKLTPEEAEKDRKQKERAAWIAEQRRLEKLREIEVQKEKERKRAAERERQKSGRGGGPSNVDRERDWEREDELRRAESARARAEQQRFQNYIPEVNLVYHDEYGRELNQKEAFRQLSHKFHGKHSGKMKTEKRIRKIEEEMAVQSMSSGDTPLGTVGAMKSVLEEGGKGYLVLSVGNRGVLPPQTPLPTPSTSSSDRPKAKSKVAAAAAAVVSAPATVTVTDTTRNVNVFNREKVAFGLGGAGKRKAEEGGGEGGKGGKRRRGE
ncbi:hypothetical protein HDV00_004382 [Rhizophlyctis rosea]|nr:hypothetical protein HDV00_004382 [Rhizophlyctis rosea]